MGSRAIFSMSSRPPSKKFEQRRLVGWSTEQMYEVVADVDKYYKFVPWCQSSKVVKCTSKNYLEAELTVGFQMLVEKYTSKVTLHPNQKVHTAVTTGSSLLFHHLDCTWSMQKGPTPNSCWLHFNVDFAFNSIIYAQLADMFFNEVVKQMVGAFEGKAGVLQIDKNGIKVT
eukprot:gene26900-biopygen4190